MSSPSALRARSHSPLSVTTDQTLRLAALPTAPKIARVFVSQMATGMGLSDSAVETAQLVVSELVTNAIRATGRVEGPPTPLPAERVAAVLVRVSCGNQGIRLDVWDSDPTPPLCSAAGPDDESGRGLMLVAVLSTRWGVCAGRAAELPGKVVWAEVAARD